MNNNMNIIEIDINKLIFPKYNPRKKLKPEDKEYKKIKKSIEEFGYTDLVIINKDNTIISGNQRTQVLMDMGYKKIKVVQIDIDKTKEKALNIALNKITGEWDYAMLGDLLLDLDAQNYDLEITGFDIDEIEGIMAPLGLEEEKEVIEDDFDCTPPEEPKAKYGDIYQLGKNFLMCGDSTKEEDVAKLMNGVMVDLLITDPPYNVAYEGKTKDALTIKNDSMDNDSFRQFLRDAFSSADKVMKPGAVFYIWHADSEGYNFRGACFDNNWKVRQCIIWNKNTMVMGRQDYQWKHEPCLYGWKDGAGHLWNSDRKQTTVIDFNKPSRNGEHPTMKPIGLFDYQIQNNTKKQDVVLDLFMGSGTTIMACEQNGRIAYGLELDPKYVDVIINRWETFTGKKAVKIN